MRVLRAQDHRQMPWKNGGGETTEIAASPDGTSLDAFDWRISMARVGAPGPFSTFPGIDRTLSMLAGGHMILRVDGRPVTLDPASQPFRFSGDTHVTSELPDGAIDDLNVMTRRSRWDHRVARYDLGEPLTVARESAVGVVIVFDGDVVVQADAQTVRLSPADAIVMSGSDATHFTATPQRAARLFWIEIRETAAV